MNNSQRKCQHPDNLECLEETNDQCSRYAHTTVSNSSQVCRALVDGTRKCMDPGINAGDHIVNPQDLYTCDDDSDCYISGAICQNNICRRDAESLFCNISRENADCSTGYARDHNLGTCVSLNSDRNSRAGKCSSN